MIDLYLFHIAPLSLSKVVSLAIVLFAFIYVSISLRRSLSNKSRSYRLGLIALNFLAGLSLAALIVSPASLQYANTSSLLITSPDYDLELLESIDYEEVFKLGGHDINLYHSDTSVSFDEAFDSDIQTVQNIQSLFWKLPEMSRLTIVGDGLSQSVLNEINQSLLQPLSVAFKPSKQKAGFSRVNWTQRLNLGNYLHIQGLIHSTDPRVNSVALIDPAGDQVTECKLLSDESFSISAKPRLAGRHTYQIVLKDSKQNEIVREAIDIYVEHLAQAKLLVVQSSPSFETKQIQNWAAENGAQLMLQTQISKDKYITRLTNIKDVRSRDFTQDLLDEFDLLIMDGRALLGLTTEQKQMLREAVELGLGLFVIADQELIDQKQNLPSWMAPIAIQQTEESREMVPYWSDNLDGFTAPIESFMPIIAADFIPENQLTAIQTNMRTLVQASNGWPIVKSLDVGLGRVTVSLMRETYRWVTNGDRTSHSHYWQNVISKAARPSESPLELQQISYPLFKGQRTKFCIESRLPIDSATVTSATMPDDEQVVHLLRGENTLSRYCGYFWPNQAGWYRVNVSVSESDQHYEDWISISDNDEWLALQQSNKRRDTLRYIQKQSLSSEHHKTKMYQPINQWIFWWIFVLCASLVWAENKYMRDE
ncbi:hypothetical protein FLL45_19580 [Aliikangiella marina]|uniref:Uncharacterized protein n=1 Tax=Aliikangiella marina TaxID=1712262 RepID=A0A545T5H2_9GAMM|nr:hypothetical protein [Aliikangiella marina]TQV72412.1 hypothetical protein FLL45_19580 [Aliikangiella marina]